jgi:thymidylate synthase (FAD)
MELEYVDGTEHPEVLVCKAARNDYMENWIGDTKFSEIMDSVDPEYEDRQLAQGVIGEHEMPQMTSEQVAKAARLIRKLLEEPGHFGPFEHPQATFTVKGVSRITMAQITRHRHISFDVQSMRYVDFEEPDYIEIPELDNADLHGRNASYDESTATLEDEAKADVRTTRYEESLRASTDAYNDLLDLGVAPENARAVLPLATKVNMTFSLNLRTLMHVADMRAAADAQWEVRELTEQLLDAAEDFAPITIRTYRRDLKDRKNRLAP